MNTTNVWSGGRYLDIIDCLRLQWWHGSSVAVAAHSVL